MSATSPNLKERKKAYLISHADEIQARIKSQVMNSEAVRRLIVGVVRQCIRPIEDCDLLATKRARAWALAAEKAQLKARNKAAARERKKARQLAYYYANKEKRAGVQNEAAKAWYHANKEKVNQRRKSAEFRAARNAEMALKREADAPQREARRMERESMLERAKVDRAARYEQEKAERKALRSATVAANREEVRARKKERTKEWKRANAERYAEYRRDYMRAYSKTESGRATLRECEKRSRKNPRNKIINSQRHRLRQFIKRTGSRVHLRFGCSPDFMRAHIEKQFTSGMTWENYGEWHIDHIMPCAQFDLSNQMHADICFNWQNLRPLWAKENHAKSDTITHPQLCLPIIV